MALLLTLNPIVISFVRVSQALFVLEKLLLYVYFHFLVFPDVHPPAMKKTV